MPSACSTAAILGFAGAVAAVAAKPEAEDEGMNAVVVSTMPTRLPGS